ncbi:hypothetical protein B0H14DRAFT_3580625 [Mycena olivaceomarginata]|nr:hypothetical protein B0H14DRAFT_3580625 [Mycena olivaceomarginata]
MVSFDAVTMIKHLSSFFPHLPPASLPHSRHNLPTVAHPHTQESRKIIRSCSWCSGLPVSRGQTMSVIDSTLSYGGDDPDSKFQCLLGHMKHLHVGNSMTWLGRISNAASAIGIESKSTHLSSVLLYSSPMPGGIGSTAMSPTHIREHFQGALPPNAPLPSSASLNFHVITGRYIKHCIRYHKTLDFQKLCKTHAYGVQVDQGEWTTCKNRTFTSTPSTASSLYPVSHPVTDIGFNQQRSKWQ